MSTIIEVDEGGTLRLPASLLPQSLPHTRYVASVQGQQVVLEPAETEKPFWRTATPVERAREFLRWAQSHSNGVGLSDEAVSRDSIYD